jgi:hypothetical protein
MAQGTAGGKKGCSAWNQGQQSRMLLLLMMLLMMMMMPTLHAFF